MHKKIKYLLIFIGSFIFTGCIKNNSNDFNKYNIHNMINDWHIQSRNVPINPFEGYCLGTSLADISNSPADEGAIDKIALETKTKPIKESNYSSQKLSKNWHRKYRNAPKNPYEGYCLYTPPTDEEYMELERKNKQNFIDNYNNSKKYPLYLDERG